MSEDEALTNFYAKLCDIANESFCLGEKILESNFFRKLLDLFLTVFSPKSWPLKRAKIWIP